MKNPLFWMAEHNTHAKLAIDKKSSSLFQWHKSFDTDFKKKQQLNINIYFNSFLLLLSAILIIAIIYLCLSSLSIDVDNYWIRENGRKEYAGDRFVLKDDEDVEKIIINDNQVRSLRTQDKCTYHACFDIYRCSSDDEKIKVYIYPIKRYVDGNGRAISSPISEEFWQLLDAIWKSEYYVDNPRDACIFIPSVDLLSQYDVRLEAMSRVLASLPFWNVGGTNHLIFNLIPGSFPDYNRRLDVDTGNAIIAGGGFDSWSLRYNLDVSVPVYSPFSRNYIKKPFKQNQNHKQKISDRKWKLIVSQINLIDDNTRAIIKKLEKEHPNEILVLGTDCESNSRHTKRCTENGIVVKKYPSLLADGNYCLILKTAYLGQPLLSDSLMLGCVPVVAIDEYILPFEDKIDWKRVGIRIHEHSLPNILDILKSFSPQELAEMQDQSFYIWERYFSKMAAIALSTLKILNERLFPQTASSREDWNKPLSFISKNPLSLVNPKMSSTLQQGFTAVILTYDRIESLFEVIHRVVEAPSCEKVVVLWNNQLKKPPPIRRWPKIHIPLKVIKTESNKLSNRFYPFNDIQTDAILAMDDDIVMLTADELEFGFQTWKEFPDRIVGFPSRVHRWDNHTSTGWRYESEWTNDASMVLTGAAFYHKHYNYLYTYEMPDEIKVWVDEKMNCEDIAMNFLVSNVTDKAPIKVLPRKKFRCPECTSSDALSYDVSNHLTARSNCINKFVSVYGRMPLKTIEFRADPVLYKDNSPEKLKKFNNVGSL